MIKHLPMISAAVAIVCGGGLVVLEGASPVRAQSAAQVTPAHERTVRFAIENMTCGLCPVTVKKAMEGVTGVKSLKIDFMAKTATVIFDPSLVTSVQIAAASANAGYPATLTRETE